MGESVRSDQHLVERADIHSLSEEELLRAIGHCFKSPGYSSNGQKGQLLVIERMRRENEKAGKGSTRLSRMALVISGLAALLAGLSLFFSYLDWQGDFQWQKEQLEKLSSLDSKEGATLEKLDALRVAVEGKAKGRKLKP